jgi:hypothetical protein
MRKMYSGHNKTVEVQRKECDSTGGLVDKIKVFHLMVRRGAYDGMKLVFEDDGNETVRTGLPPPTGQHLLADAHHHPAAT